MASELAKTGILGPQNHQGIGMFEDTTKANPEGRVVQSQFRRSIRTRDPGKPREQSFAQLLEAKVKVK